MCLSYDNGFVATRMTDGVNLPPLLTTTPEEVADATFYAHHGGRDVVYARSIWRPIMMRTQFIPEPFFGGLKYNRLTPGSRIV